MANRPSTSRPASGRGNPPGGSRRRTPPPPVKKPFPWGIVATSTILGVVLLGILVYAFTNQGAGFVDALKKADNSVPGVSIYKNEARNHVLTPVTYPQTPPVGGNHNPVPQTCAVYTAPLANEHAVHSLEHGAVWITYRPDLPPAAVAALATKVSGNPYRLMSPYPGLKTPISLQAWGRQLFVRSATDPAIDRFLSAYTAGPQAPEPGAACTGYSKPGPLEQAPTTTTTVMPSVHASTK